MAARTLRELGHRPMVFERRGAVGGLVRRHVEDGHIFDLGANYVVAGHRRIRRLARQLRWKTTREASFHGLRFRDPEHAEPGQPLESFPVYEPIVRAEPSKLALLRKAARYILLRRRLRSIIDRPGWSHLADSEEGRAIAGMTFLDWLRSHDLEVLAPSFEIPVSIMGYGALDRIPAPYVLRHVDAQTYAGMLLRKVLPIPALQWPRRFERGYYGLWEQVAGDLDVRLNASVQRIVRRDDGVTVFFRERRQAGDVDILGELQQLEFDALVMACVPFPGNLGDGVLELCDDELRLFRQVRRQRYAVATVRADLPDRWGVGIWCHYPFGGAGWRPWAFVRQYEGSDVLQFYALLEADEPVPFTCEPEPEVVAHAPAWDPDVVERAGLTAELASAAATRVELPPHDGDPATHWCRTVRTVPPELEYKLVRAHVMDTISRYVRGFGATVRPSELSTLNIWSYFHHVPPELFSAFFKDLEQLQGQRRTFYTGGFASFELVNSAICHAEDLMQRHFPRCRS